MKSPALSLSRHFGRMFFAVSIALLFSCGPKNTYAPSPPPPVTVQQPLVEDTTTYLEFPGRTEAFEAVEIRARVKGFLQSIEFQAGSYVEENALLFKIEPEQFQAALEAAKGELERAKANLEIATANRERRARASKTGGVSKIDVLSAVADEKAAEAAIKIALANVDDARRNLDYTEIRSPIAGRISRSLVDVGNLVGASEPTLLTTVVRDDPIYVNFEANERAILPYLSERPNKQQPEFTPREAGYKVKLLLADGTEYPLIGEIDFIDNVIDPETGTVKVRARFDNSKGDLAAGLFVRVLVPEEAKNALLVPREALQRDLGGTFALVVGKDDVVERRPVKTAQNVGALQIVTEGLQPPDRVIVKGLQSAREGVKVSPEAAPAAPAVEETPGESTEEETPAASESDETAVKETS